jgi:hypothetical protein
MHMYMARVDPHLTFGGEVLDIGSSGPALNKEAQGRYIR